ncbi:MAG: monovalent cation/H(+) antiporter subunit G [Clostridia bacterium]|nr:monovalent cation/H(+) antiporter subunit G [Clostridia bacterium]
MIAWIRFLLTAVFVLAGLAVCCIGVYGVYRFNYAANRMHASALNDTLGIGLCLVGFAISAPDAFTAVKILLVVVFYYLSAPVASHLLCRLEIETNEQRDAYMNVHEWTLAQERAAAQAGAPVQEEAPEPAACADEDGAQAAQEEEPGQDAPADETEEAKRP